jgi:hypothetical protein
MSTGAARPMIESYYVVVPADPWHVPPPEAREAALSYLKTIEGWAGTEISMDVGAGPQVLMGTASAANAICPRCGRQFAPRWIRQRLDELWDAKQKCFAALGVVMPCCQAAVDFHTIDFPLAGDEAKPRAEWRPASTVGFARVALSAENGRLLGRDELDEVARLLGCPVRQVYELF